MPKKHWSEVLECWSEVLECQCGKRFRSTMAEARHRHNFPLLCKPKKLPAAVRVLRKLVEFRKQGKDATLTQAGIRVFIDADDEQTTGAVVKQLHYWTAIRESYRSQGYVIWELNNTGEQIARRPELGDEIFAAILGNKGPFTIDANDRIKFL